MFSWFLGSRREMKEQGEGEEGKIEVQYQQKKKLNGHPPHLLRNNSNSMYLHIQFLEGAIFYDRI